MPEHIFFVFRHEGTCLYNGKYIYYFQNIVFPTILFYLKIVFSDKMTIFSFSIYPPTNLQLTNQ